MAQPLVHPVAAAHYRLIAALATIRAPRIPVTPTPGDFGTVKDYVEAVAKAADAWLLDVAAEASANSHEITVSYFERVFSSHLEDTMLLADFLTADERLEGNVVELAADPRGWAKAERMEVE